MKEIRFYRCNICGNIVAMIEDSGTVPFCCGMKMTLLIPGEKDATLERHVPVYKIECDELDVKVGSFPHPSLDAHYIQWIVATTNKGAYLRMLKAGDDPEATFRLTGGEKVTAVYEYCNVHSLWKSETPDR